jgi:hypothetical protein
MEGKVAASRMRAVCTMNLEFIVFALLRINEMFLVQLCYVVVNLN